MAKKFAPRVAKKNRKTLDLSTKIDKDLKDLFKLSDEKLLKGAKLDEIRLKDIKVLEQVRTKFNDSSIKELAANIKANGLIQPLVLHRTGRTYTLICGERRFRAMTSIKMDKCPCFIIENKTAEELMAIQFSENSSREALHYIDKADGILNYQKATRASERKITQALGISKSEVHRSLLIAKLSKKLKEASKKYDIEKYVLLEFDAMEGGALKTKIQKRILAGEVTKRSQLKKLIASGGVLKATRRTATKKKTLPTGMTANAFLKAMKSQQKNMKMDAKTKKALEALLSETQEMIEQ